MELSTPGDVRIRHYLAATRKRLNLFRLSHIVGQVLLVALLLQTTVFLASRVLGYELQPYLWVVLGMVGLSTPLLVFRSRISALATAQFLDERYGLAARVVSCYFIFQEKDAQEKDLSGVRQALVADTADVLSLIAPKLEKSGFAKPGHFPFGWVNLGLGVLYAVLWSLPAEMFLSQGTSSKAFEEAASTLDDAAAALRRGKEQALANELSDQARRIRREGLSSQAASELREMAVRMAERMHAVRQENLQDVIQRHLATARSEPVASSLPEDLSFPEDSSGFARRILDTPQAQREELADKIAALSRRLEDESLLSLAQAIREREGHKLAALLSQIQTASGRRLAGMRRSQALLAGLVKKLGASGGHGGGEGDGETSIPRDSTGPAAGLSRRTPDKSSVRPESVQPPDRNEGGVREGNGYLKKAWWPPEYHAVVRKYFSVMRPETQNK
jgi:hypothetical protein